MGWARLDDGFHDHPKLIGLPLDALGLWTKCFTWAHRHQGASIIRGHIPEGLPANFAGNRGPKLAALLVKHRLWDVEEGLGGWLIHDYSEYLPATERPSTANEVSKARSEAGKRGAKARWQKEEAAKQADSNLPSGSDGKPIAPSRPDPLATDNHVSPVPETAAAADDDDGRSRREAYWRGFGIRNPRRVLALLVEHVDRPLTEQQAIQVVTQILARSKTPPRDPQRYVEGAITQSWAEIQQQLDEAVIAA